VDPTLAVSYALAGIGLAVLAWSLALTVSLSVNRELAVAVVRKTLAAATSTAPASCARGAGRHVLRGHPGGIVAGQATASRDPAIVDGAVGPGFEAAATRSPSAGGRRSSAA